ncbi:MAG TPA: CoA transferase, partial [Actinomycetota bacterium]|nr:CoA transferase [Actinomycetota bacterium]
GAARDELERQLDGLFGQRPAGDWLDLLVAAGIPCGAVNDVGDVMEHPQLAHNRLVAEVGSPAGPLPVVGSPFLVAGQRSELGGVPALGEHTDEVFRERGVEPA